MNRPSSSHLRKMALVTSGFDRGGGIPMLARWLRGALQTAGGYKVDVHDLATSRRDEASRRLMAPPSWARRSLQRPSRGADPVVHWGGNAVEIETMRYRPRRELDGVLRQYDLVQVVAGTPALGASAIRAGVPVVLLTATLAKPERQRLLAELTGPPRIWRQGMTLLNSRIERRVLRSVDALLVLNSVMLDHGRSSGSRRVVKTFPGIDTDRFVPTAAGWRRDGYILSVCRLDDPRKGLERTIRAYAQMLQADGSVPPLVLAGRHQLPESLSDLVVRIGLSSRVTVCSDVDPADLPELYRGASVFVQTSYEEGLGISALEAMASGVPVVSTATAGAKETVVDGVTGWLVPPDPPMDVPRLVADRVFNVLRRDGIAFSAGGRDRSVDIFADKVAVRRLTDIYDDVLAAPQSRG